MNGLSDITTSFWKVEPFAEVTVRFIVPGLPLSPLRGMIIVPSFNVSKSPVA